MTSKALLFISSIALAAGLVAAPVGAAGLLGGGLLAVDSGPAGNDATVNVGLGAGDGDSDNLVDLRLGKRGLLGNGSGGIAAVSSGPAGSDATINVGLGSGGGDGNNLADVRLGGGGAADAGAAAGLAGDADNGLLRRNLVDASPLLAGLDLRGLGLDPGTAGGNGVGADGRVLVGSLESAAVACSVNDGRDVLQRAARVQVDAAAWRSAANVEIVPVTLCPQARAQVAQVFNASGKIDQLRAAVSADALITASLSRTRYDAGNVFAVEASGGKLRVYVF